MLRISFALITLLPAFAYASTSTLIPSQQTAVIPEPESVRPASIGTAAFLPRGSVFQLNQQRLKDQFSLAIASPIGRLSTSIRFAKTLLALGMGPEASEVLKIASEGNSAVSTSRLIQNLAIVADVESHRELPAAYPPFSASGGSSELEFWHSVALAEEGKTAIAGRLLAGTISVLENYSKPIQELLSPLVAETLVAGGQLAAAQALTDAMAQQPSLNLARAELLEALGHNVDALIAYRNLARSNDVRSSGIATTRLILLRHAMKQLTAKDAAAELSRHLYAWRGRSHERHVRVALAKLFADGHEWPQAFSEILATTRRFPDQKKELQRERKSLFKRFLASSDRKRMPPIDFVTVLQDCKDLLPEGSDGVPLLNDLAKEFLKLDLPQMAAPVVKELLARASSEPHQQTTSLTHALAHLENNDVADAEQEIAQAAILNEPSQREEYYKPVVMAAKEQKRKKFKTNSENFSPFKLTSLASNHNFKEKKINLTEQARKRKQPDTMVKLSEAAANKADVPELADLGEKHIEHIPRGRKRSPLNLFTTPTINSATNLNTALKQISLVERLSASVPTVMSSSVKSQ